MQCMPAAMWANGGKEKEEEEEEEEEEERVKRACALHNYSKALKLACSSAELRDFLPFRITVVRVARLQKRDF
uniref:Uncharacterized protein n=1 Tax=Vespula pensylvanica TaxID=30213 RepID=A0A834NZ34_VESPE|nr:hypothetical protein H0235_009574 [Vespula pensylvanica]